MHNPYLDHAVTAIEHMSDLPKEDTYQLSQEFTMILIGAKATIGAARELQEANRLAREAAERQNTANAIAYASLMAHVGRDVPEALMSLLAEVVLSTPEAGAGSTRTEQL